MISFRIWILVATNSIIVQRNSEWYVANKFQIEQEDVLPTQQYIDFDEVNWRTQTNNTLLFRVMAFIMSLGVRGDIPRNFDFSEELAEWTAVNGFDGEVKK